MPVLSISKTARKLAAMCGGAVLLVLVSGCHTPAEQASGAAYDVTIKRTPDGVPHIDAADWGSLGYGVGFAQAQDALCTLSDAFVTWRGKRSANFGAEGHPPGPSTFGRPANLDADFFFRSVIDHDAVTRFRDAQPPRERALVAGYADGYNRYIDELHAGHFPGAHASCAGARWVTHIDTDDLYRRFIAANLAGGTMPFLRGIARAQPPGAAGAAATGGEVATLASANGLAIGGQAGIGSNALAFGAASTKDGQSLLFGNPHWFWQGPDRFYQMQLRIPQQMDAAGAAFLGVPMVMIGFNENIAWTHTVSSARRFGIFQLSLVPGAPTHYRYEGRDEAMRAVPATVQVRDMKTGALAPVTRTLYRTRFGPVADLSSLSPALAWNGEHAFALADVNADNPGTFSNFLQWNQASSLDDFIATQKHAASMPWVNTFAIGRGSADVWFADIGAVPGVTDALANACTTPAGRAVDARLPGVPFLDGSRAACDWTARKLSGAVRTGRMPVASMPELRRADYVGNFNGSYWLTNPHAPLTGYAQVLGQTGTVQSLRTRLGHGIAAQAMSAPGGVDRAALERTVLASTSMSAQLFLKPVTDAVCKTAIVRVTADPAKPDQAQEVDIRAACAALRQWDGTANVNARGANLWDAFWQRAASMPALQHYTTPFDAAHPLTTPDGLDTSNPATVRALGDALGGAVLALRANDFAVDATRGEMHYISDGARRIPLYGGCDLQGYFTVACAMQPLNKTGESLDSDAHGNSYMQVVSFGAEGPQADTMLTTGVSEDPASPWYRATTRVYAQKTWTRFPFSEQALDAIPDVTKTVLTGARTAAR
ncbi:penicillin acylase family protein [Caballeronia sp. LZ033]|uniref:penicillin acylase family protein n=1 Tax=Caballeronia sp. LZ033 TaxID=3038566 RepID=UPI00285A7B45|nr:penicillin acylase family protein [Caballeronia sp. LZ033]MDR5815311.1 penicillin acylase family protein [Caballeronia sp. LZ033]